jgi:hypothetical protein
MMLIFISTNLSENDPQITQLTQIQKGKVSQTSSRNKRLTAIDVYLRNLCNLRIVAWQLILQQLVGND